MNFLSRKCLAVATLALVVAGCSGGGPRLYKAGGKVTNNKVPVEGAQVTFVYDDGNFASGYTKPDGTFELTYMNRPGGAMPGKCTVTISKKAGAVGIMTRTNFKTVPKSEAEQKAMMAEQQRMMEETGRKQEEQEAAGGGSGDIMKSGLVVEVTTNESQNNFAIDLNDFKK